MDDNCYHINDDYLDDDDDGIMYSTKNYISDSDEEDLTAFLRGKTKKKRFVEFDDCSSEDENEMDDFEKEMAAELNATMEKLLAPLSKPSTSKKDSQNVEGEDTHYDKIYFDSDEDDDSSQTLGKKGKRKDKHKIISNDDLFYDPMLDDIDQAWVDSNRRKYLMRSKKSKTKDGKIKTQALSQSDAVLNCPACFSTLCFDCQRHEIYKNQYRAMFVFNCVVDKSERLHFAIKEDKKFKKVKKNKKKMAEYASKIEDKQEVSLSKDASKIEEKQEVSLSKDASKIEDKQEVSSSQDASKIENEQEVSSSGDALKIKDKQMSPSQDTNQNSEDKEKKEELFYPVKCALCNTKIAVQDEEEVYHFFNVLTSY